MKNWTLLTFIFTVFSGYGINAPTLNTPANQGSVAGFQTTLMINGVAGATGFQIQVDSIASFSSSWMSLNTFTPIGQPQGTQGAGSPVLRLNRTYFWRARAFAPNDTSVWTAARSFTTTQTATFLLNPASNSNGPIQRLRCSNAGINPMIKYLFEVDTSNTLTSPLRKIVIVSENQWVDSSLIRFNRTVFWRAAAINSLGDTLTWSPIWKYSIDKGPTLNMTPNAILIVDPEFITSWNTAGLASVQVQTDTVNTFNSPHLRNNFNSVGVIRDTLRDLLFNKIYYIRIRGIYHTDTSAWSPIPMFRVATGNITNPNFNGGTIGSITQINFSWIALKGARVMMKLYGDSALTKLLADTVTSLASYTYRDTLRLNKWYQLHIRYFHQRDTAITLISHFRIFNGQVSLFSPEVNATNLPISVPLQFRSYSWASKYLLQIDTGAVFPATRSSYFQQFTSFDTVPILKYLTKTALLAYNKTYSWRVFCITQQDTGAPAARTFTTAARPTIYSPPNGFIGIGTDINGLITSIQGSTYVQWQLDTTTSFNSPLLQSAIDTAAKDDFDTMYVLVNLPDNQRFHTKYFWRCRNLSSNDTSQWSNTFWYTTTTDVTISRPANGSTNVPLKVPLDWSIQGSNLSQRFQYQIGTDSTFAATPIVTLGVNEFSEDTFIANYSTTYYWRARAFNAVDTSKWSVRYSFTTVSTPLVGNVILISPSNNATLPPGLISFSWADATNATSYDVQVATDQDFANLVASGIPTFPGVQWQNAQPRTQYYWRVRGKNDFNTGLWSVRLFKTSPPLSVVEVDEFKSLNIYPIPASKGLLTIAFPLPISCTIYTIDGKRVWQSPSANPIFEINIDEWANGIYLVEVESGTGKTHRKIVVQH